MNLGTFLEFFNTHNQAIFAGTLAIILLISGYLIYRSFFGAEPSTEASAADLSRIEESLKKILSHSSVAGAATTPTAETPEGPTSISAGGAAAGPAGAAGDEKLKQELEARQKQIDELKKQLEAIKGQDNTPELLAKIKSLEERLAEYEIIEDDIADLSLYKEENVRLKKELEALKASGPAVITTNANQATLVEEFESKVEAVAGEKPDAAPAATAPAPEEAPVPTEVPADALEQAPVTAAATEADSLEAVMAEASAKAAEITGTPGESGPAAVENAATVENAAAMESTTAVESSVPAEPKTDTKPAAESPAKSDIFAEMQDEPQGQDLLAELGEIDADRMLEEIKDLGEGMGDAGVLEEAMDIEKLASEAEKKG